MEKNLKSSIVFFCNNYPSKCFRIARFFLKISLFINEHVKKYIEKDIKQYSKNMCPANQVFFLAMMTRAYHKLFLEKNSIYKKNVIEFLECLGKDLYHNVPLKRIGGENDGGYAMLPPEKNDICYSFGVSEYSPWDLYMANKGHVVYQYDGTIEKSYNHPLLKFVKKNIAKADTSKTLSVNTIIKNNKHESNKNIILQCDIEGYEWEMIDSFTSSVQKNFSQIICEFHNINPLDTEQTHRQIRLIEKLKNTHKIVHIHYNNNGEFFLFDDGIFLGTLVEITFVRNDIFEKNKTTDALNSEVLDAPCISELPDVVFEVLHR